ncbi:relaxase/mobilization nuclease domain-containing protein [Segetibacter koreensis]|uniref:relaxase/mobilization nuclease domain-containing protein n=1 Tax=Segetibacter koreensis TaxID=398037 RepID=UPI000377AE0B|nr:relaxase/mobilization nuclease domain-containing protein [Segetibacter koreensis]
MVSKVFSGHSFYHACRYIVNKPGAEVLECEGIRVHDFRVMAEDFLVQQQRRPGKQKACFHCCLSFYPGEKLSDEHMAKIAKEYLKKFGVVDTQYAITKHTDRRHLHLHIVANMVNDNGKSISDSYLGLRGKKIAQQLTQQYDLVPAISKNLDLTNFPALRKSEANKYKVYNEIMEALPYCNTLQDLEKKLQQRGIEVQYKYKGQTQEKQGISFKIQDDIFKGSKVDRQFSLGNLEKTIALNQQLLHLNAPAINGTRHYSSASAGQQLQNILKSKISSRTETIAEILLKPEENKTLTPQELLKEHQRKKKKSKKRGLHR